MADILTPDPPNVPLSGARPYWMPDTKGWLACGIVLLVMVIVLVLLLRPVTMDERISNLLSAILGVLLACFKDVFAYFFNSTQASEDKNRTIAQLGASLATSTPVPSTEPKS